VQLLSRIHQRCGEDHYIAPFCRCDYANGDDPINSSDTALCDSPECWLFSVSRFSSLTCLTLPPSRAPLVLPKDQLSSFPAPPYTQSSEYLVRLRPRQSIHDPVRPATTTYLRSKMTCYLLIGALVQPAVPMHIRVPRIRGLAVAVQRTVL
jgi:hypothetical protein